MGRSKPVTDLPVSLSAPLSSAISAAVPGQIRHKNRRLWTVLWCLLLGLAAVFCLVGRMPVTPAEIGAVLSSFPRFLGDLFNQDYARFSPGQQVMFLIRLPRIVMALFIGGGLAVSGAVYQGVFRNPLVSPDILGVAAGCTFGAALGLLLPGSDFLTVRVTAFVMGVVAVFMATSIARMVRQDRILVLILTGIITGSLFNALFMIVKSLADPYNELPGIVFWVMGSLSRASWQEVFYLAAIVLPGYLVFHLFRYSLDIMSLGDDQARSLGLRPERLRLIFLGTASFMVSACVASAGQVAWVGLVIPHMVRTWIGSDHRLVIPCSAILGAIFLLVTDGLARSLTSSEFPLGVVTSLVGAPLFGWLLYRNRMGFRS